MLQLGAFASSAIADSVGPEPVLIIGVGNYLMGDEGVGVHLLHALEQRSPVAGIRLLDGGTGGVNLLPEMDGARDIIMIDATRDGRPAGTISLLQPRCPGELPRGLSAHDFGLKDLFAAAALLGEFPRVHLFTVSVETVNPMSMELSPAVAAAIPVVLRIVDALAAELVRKTAPAA